MTELVKEQFQIPSDTTSTEETSSNSLTEKGGNPEEPAQDVPPIGKNSWKELKMLTTVVSRYPFGFDKNMFPLTIPPVAPISTTPTAATSALHSPSLPNDHRISCHRCGNIRKRKTVCSRSNCPHTFCGRCSDKLRLEYGPEIFANGCPVCKDLCCCSSKSVNCNRKFHCYRKCPATKVTPKNNGLTASVCGSSAMPMPMTISLAAPLTTSVRPSEVDESNNSNDETTSVEDASDHHRRQGGSGRKEGMTALLEACDKVMVDGNGPKPGEERRTKRQKLDRDSTAGSVARTIDEPESIMIEPKREVTRKTPTAKTTTNHAFPPHPSIPMGSYPLPFYGFPSGAMAAAAGPYGMIPLVPAHMLPGYAQYMKAAVAAAKAGGGVGGGTTNNNSAEEGKTTADHETSSFPAFGKGSSAVPPLIPFFPYYMPSYSTMAPAATAQQLAHLQTALTAPPASTARKRPSNMSKSPKTESVTTTNAGINLLAAISSHYLSGEDDKQEVKEEKETKK